MLVTLPIKTGSDLNAKNKEDETSILLAALNGYLDIGKSNFFQNFSTRWQSLICQLNLCSFPFLCIHSLKVLNNVVRSIDE